MASLWKTAFLQQAKSDYEVFKFLRMRDEKSFPICHQLHYLQMVTEKMAKGYSAPRDGSEPPHLHSAFASWLRRLVGRPEFLIMCEKESEKDKYVRLLKDVAAISLKIESLAPNLSGDGPNPEYPWRIDGSITAPANYSFSEIIEHPKYIRMIQFIDKMIGIS